MLPNAPRSDAPAIPLPEVDSDVPVAVIPVASIAPLEGPPDGERINLFTLAPTTSSGAHANAAGDALGSVRDRVLDRPLSSVAAAFVLGLVAARVLR